MSQAKLQAARELIMARDFELARSLLKSMQGDPTAERWLAKLDQYVPPDPKVLSAKEFIELEVERAYRRGFHHALGLLAKYYELAGELSLHELQRMVTEQDSWRKARGLPTIKVDETASSTLAFPPLYKKFADLQRRIRMPKAI